MHIVKPPFSDSPGTEFPVMAAPYPYPGRNPDLHPLTLLDSISPYGSRRVTVEYDGFVTAAYLHGDTAVISATWIANHWPAPEGDDEERLSAGQAPPMPAMHTTRPEGRPPLRAGALEALWSEEGDWVAILENGDPLVVIPGWSAADRGMPGYSRDAIGQTPFAWSLADAIGDLKPRLERSRAYWRWRQDPGGWHQFREEAVGHLMARLGPPGRYWDTSAGRQPLTAVTEWPPAPHRTYTILSTVGMSCQLMPVIEQVLDDPGEHGRIELALATTLPAAQAALVFFWLATYPWQAVTWLGPGHTVRWYHQPAGFPLGDGAAVLLLDSPGVLPGPEPPDLSGFTVAGDPVRWLWIIPISGRDRQLALERGSARLLAELAGQQRSWITGPQTQHAPLKES